MRARHIREEPPQGAGGRVPNRIQATADRLSLPILLATIPTGACLLGWFLDRRLRTFPWLTMLLLGLGFVGAGRELWLVAQRPNSNDKTRRE